MGPQVDSVKGALCNNTKRLAVREPRYAVGFASEVRWNFDLCARFRRTNYDGPKAADPLSGIRKTLPIGGIRWSPSPGNRGCDTFSRAKNLSRLEIDIC